MNPLSSLRTVIALAAAGLAAAGLLSACTSGLAPDAVALAFEPSHTTPDAAATRAVATFAAALQTPAVFAARPSVTPAPSATMTPTPSPSPTPTATPTYSATPSPTPQPTRTTPPTPTATATRRPTATLPPTPTPDLAATAEALQRQIDAVVAATLAAQPTLVASPQPQQPSQPQQPPIQDGELEPADAAGAPAADGAQIVGMLGTVDAGEEGGLVNLRTGPGTDSPVLLGVDSGQRVLVLARNQAATWLYIRTADGVTGWMSAEYVRTGQPVASYPVQ